ncbi:MAG: transcriptional regulator [Hydrogenophilales bacterium 12-61-10]|nr:MAG: transcriptional regulator [Hydrogenophilales bacterium 12-61-10]OYX28245.1 MAG: transcriptional regulator [Hydrogenophilales bacterium 32-62-9]
MDNATLTRLESAEIPLERDGFLRNLLRHLAGTLEDVVGLQEASGFISVVGQKVGDELNQLYRHQLAVENLSREQVAAVMVDLKLRIRGEFFIEYEDDEKIILQSRSCPFEDKVIGKTSLCMMTSNVLGTIAAENLGYAKVVLDKAIARGDSGCRVVVYLARTAESHLDPGIEYFKSSQ